MRIFPQQIQDCMRNEPATKYPMAKISRCKPPPPPVWWTFGTTRGGARHLGLTHTETQQGRLWTACGQRPVDSKNSHTAPATTSTTSVRQPLGATDAQTAHHATSNTAPAHQPLGSVNAETTPAGAPATPADRKQRHCHTGASLPGARATPAQPASGGGCLPQSRWAV